jgi:hypothetical protein
VGNFCLHGAVCRQRHEVWMNVGNMKLCVGREFTVCKSWLYEALCRRRPELRVRVVT